MGWPLVGCCLAALARLVDGLARNILVLTPLFWAVAVCARMAGLGKAGFWLTGWADSGGCAGWAYCWAGMDHNGGHALVWAAVACAQLGPLAGLAFG